MSIPAIPSRKNQDPAHVMDFPSLNLGHTPCSRTDLYIVDLDIHVYGLEEIKGSTRPVAVIILTHGWANNAAQMENMAHGLFGEIRKRSAAKPATWTRDVLVVTYDQRNHGVRRLKKDQLSYNKNPRRLEAMAATVTGGVQDNQFIMKFLEDYLYPLGERQIVEFMVTGVSLGGHVAWRLLKEDPRIQIAAPIIAVPADSLINVHTPRFVADGTINTDKMYYPKATREFYEGKSPKGVYKGKKILALHGSIDEVVPSAAGQKDWDNQIVPECGPGNTEQVIQQGQGHICTPEMVGRAAEWFYRWGVDRAQDAARAKL